MRHDEARRILGLGENFTIEDAKSAYRSKSLQTHPDKGGSTEAFTRVKEAYELCKHGRIAPNVGVGSGGGSGSTNFWSGVTGFGGNFKRPPEWDKKKPSEGSGPTTEKVAGFQSSSGTGRRNATQQAESEFFKEFFGSDFVNPEPGDFFGSKKTSKVKSYNVYEWFKNMIKHFCESKVIKENLNSLTAAQMFERMQVTSECLKDALKEKNKEEILRLTSAIGAYSMKIAQKAKEKL